MRFLVGLLLGLVATSVNFGILYAVVRLLVRGQSGAARFIAPLAQVGRYIIFGAIIFVAIRYRLGTVWGLLAGVTIGIAGFLTWQVGTDARNRRSG